MNRKVLITVLSMNHLPFTQLALKNLYKNTSKKHTILVVDNGSNKETIYFLRNEKNLGNIELIENGQNLGIAGSINIGMKLSLERDMDFCFFSNDLVAAHGWMEELQKGAYIHEKIGACSPYIGPEATYDNFINMDFRERYRRNYWPLLRNDPTVYELERMVDELHGGDFQEFGKIWQQTRKNIPPLYEWFSMCMYIKKSTIEKIGLFDEQFYPSHWEDMDYIIRLNNAELYRTSVTGSYLFHFSTITTRSEWKDGDKELNKLANDNEGKFNRKWRVFLPRNQMRHDIPDGDKYDFKEAGPKLDEFFEVSDKEHSRPHPKWWSHEEYRNYINAKKD